MLVSRRAVRLLLATVIAMLPPASHADPEISAYRWDAPAGPTNIDGFSNWLGSPVTIASVFLGEGVFHGEGSWSAIEGQEWQLSAWAQWVRAENGRNVTIGIGMFPSGESLANCAAGAHDAHWRKLADNLAYYGLHWAYLRPGWGMDFSWIAWGAPPGSGKEASYAGCFRRIVQVMRQAQPANQWKFVLTTSTNWNNRSYLEAIWPGDAYVDVVAMNFYDASWAPNTYPYPSGCNGKCRATRQQNAWNSSSPKLYMMRDFAVAHGKKMAFSEWGVLIRPDGRGGGDNPDFIRRMHEFIVDPANNVAFHSYYNASIPGEMDTRLTDPTASDDPGGATRFPNSASTFQQLFGPQSPRDVTFSAPAAGATISGSFSASSGCQVTGTGIIKVVFFMDNTQLNTENSAPWQCTLDTRNFANGTHTLRAVAYNAAGASTTITRTVNVQNASASGPTGVAFAAPAAGATISGSFSASSGCQVNGIGIAQVVFFMNNTQLNTDNSAPWQCTLDTRSFANGTHMLRAVAYSSAGASTTITRTVNVQNTAGGGGGGSAVGRVFYDGFEDGTTNAWQKDDYRNRCQVVTSATDGAVGPYAGTRMARCNWNGGVAWNDPAAFENLRIATDNYNDELFIRARIRLDQNMSAGTKLLRIYYFQGGIYHDLFESTGSGGGNGLKNEGAHTGGSLQTYWGGASGDDTHINRGKWHKIEYYIRQSTGAIKVWHNGILVRNDTGINFQGVKWSPFYIASNAAQPFDGTNHVYFDEVEVYSDRGTGATGAMSSGTIQQ